MVEMYANGVAARRSCKIVKTLHVPQVMVCTNTQYCKVVQIFYTLKVEATIPGFHANIELVFPITIGSIPLHFAPIPTVLPTAPLLPPISHLTSNIPSAPPVITVPSSVMPQVSMEDLRKFL